MESNCTSLCQARHLSLIGNLGRLGSFQWWGDQLQGGLL